jgi:hypothetical protein
MKAVLIPLAVGAGAAWLSDQFYDQAQSSASFPDVVKNNATVAAYLVAGLAVLAAHHFTKAA